MTTPGDADDHILYNLMSESIGEQGARIFMNRLPPTNWHEHITGDQLAARIADLRGEMHTELAALRVEMTDGFASLRGDMTDGFAALRGEMTAGFAEVDTKVSVLRDEMTTGFGSLRGDMADRFAKADSKIGVLRDEMTTGFARTDTQIAETAGQIVSLRAELKADLRSQMIWLIGTMLALAGLIIAVLH